MAIYHLSVKPVSRGEGRSATAASAYRSATRITDLQSGQVFDYTRKGGVVHAEILVPSNAAGTSPDWARAREVLWNAAEAAERRKDGRVAREYEVALPHELTPEQRLRLARTFAKHLVEWYGVAVDLAIHKPHREGDDRNHHAHILTTTRAVSSVGLGPKTTVELGDKDRAKLGLGRGADEVVAIRARWAELTNAALEQARREERVDHRNLAEQGIDRVPTSHFGPVVAERLRRGKDSDVAARIREEEKAEVVLRLASAAERGRLDRESRGLDRSIIDLETTLKSAIALRTNLAHPTSSSQAQRVDAQQRWLEAREKFKEFRPAIATSSEIQRFLDGDNHR